MIKIVAPLPPSVYVACSGGVDSMAALDFLKRRHDVTVAYFNHQTDYGHMCERNIQAYCASHDIPLMLGNLAASKPKQESQEEFWRNQRIHWFHQLSGTVVTAHHLDDCMETYLFNCLHGKHHTIAYQNGNIVRPFLTTTKNQLQSWCEKNQVPWWGDPSNMDTRFMRNHIRHNIMPQALIVNPGLAKTVKRLVVEAMPNTQ